MSNLMGESHDGLVFAGLDVVVDEGDKCRVTSGKINIYILFQYESVTYELN